MESDLARNLIDLCNRFYGLTSSKVRTLEWEYAITNSIKIPSKWLGKLVVCIDNKAYGIYVHAPSIEALFSTAFPLFITIIENK